MALLVNRSITHGKFRGRNVAPPLPFAPGFVRQDVSQPDGINVHRRPKYHKCHTPQLAAGVDVVAGTRKGGESPLLVALASVVDDDG